jgi:hypothetical protein
VNNREENSEDFCLDFLISFTVLGLQFLLLLQEFNLSEQRSKDSLEQFWYSALDITASHGLNDKGKL